MFNVLEHLNIEVIIIARGGGSFEDLSVFNEELIAGEIFNSKIPIITGIGHETDVTITDFVADIYASTPTAAANSVLPDKEEYEVRISEIKYKLYIFSKNIIDNYKKELRFSEEKTIFKKPFTKILEYKQLVDDKQIILNKILYNNLKIFKKDTDKSETILHSLNPEAVLKRGYTITLRNEEIATIENIKGGDEITTIFKNGKVESRVIKKVENEN